MGERFNQFKHDIQSPENLALENERFTAVMREPQQSRVEYLHDLLKRQAQEWKLLSDYGPDAETSAKGVLGLTGGLYGFDVKYVPEQAKFLAYLPEDSERDLISISFSERSFVLGFRYGARFQKP